MNFEKFKLAALELLSREGKTNADALHACLKELLVSADAFEVWTEELERLNLICPSVNKSSFIWRIVETVFDIETKSYSITSAGRVELLRMEATNPGNGTVPHIN